MPDGFDVSNCQRSWSNYLNLFKNETFNLVNITESAPFIELKSNDLTQSIKTTYNNIVTYCNECNLIKSDISLCKTNILNILMKFNEEYRGWESEHYNYYGKDNNRL